MLRTLIIFAALLMQGCLYGDVKLPLDLDLNQTKLGDKVGRSSSYSVLWLVAWGDSSTAKAAEDGHITTLNHMDQEFEVILFGLYTKSTTIAYGD